MVPTSLSKSDVKAHLSVINCANLVLIFDFFVRCRAHVFLEESDNKKCLEITDPRVLLG